MSVDSQVIRLAMSADSQDPPQDIVTSAPPAVWVATNLSFQFLLENPDGTVMDISDVDSVTLEVKDPISKTTAPFMAKTLASSDLDATVTQDDWDAGTKQHGTFEFDWSETGLPVLGNSTGFWLVVSSIINTGSGPHRVVFGAGNITFNQSGYDANPPASVIGPTYFTASESDARYSRTIDITYLERGIDAATASDALKMPLAGGTFTGNVVFQTGKTLTIPTNGLILTDSLTGPSNTSLVRAWVAVQGIGASGSNFYLPLYQ